MRKEIKIEMFAVMMCLFLMPVISAGSNLNLVFDGKTHSLILKEVIDADPFDKTVIEVNGEENTFVSAQKKVVGDLTIIPNTIRKTDSYVDLTVSLNKRLDFNDIVVSSQSEEAIETFDNVLSEEISSVESGKDSNVEESQESQGKSGFFVIVLVIIVIAGIVIWFFKFKK